MSSLGDTILPIQGPPGTGKTHTGALMILKALGEGKRVGITATSHKVIGNLLEKVCSLARARGVEVRGIQKARDEQRCPAKEIVVARNNDDVPDALQEGKVTLAAGTAWLWSRPEMQGSVDLLFVDEAGQFSLANALAVAPATRNLILLGDPRQLEQPQQGIHPPGTDMSALEHLLQGQGTMPPDRGLFLNETWRLHPDVCRFTSEVFYQGRLRSRDGLEAQCVFGQLPLDKTGLRLVPAEHAGRAERMSRRGRSDQSHDGAAVVRRLCLDRPGR